ncbi:hypothetical protein ACHQM5_007809 [Ranunculus cassubicifolius]
MDFHTLSRRELQALCKKNKIPANLTNVAMADSLSNLTKVEGIEELNQLVSQTPQTCKGSLARATKDAVVSMDNEPSSISITTRTRVRTQARGIQEDVNHVSLVNFKESTTAAETFQTPATRTRRRAVGTSVCKGAIPAAKEIENPIGSRYATRRSARLVPESDSVTVGRSTKEEADHLVKKQSFVEKVDAEEETKGETHGVESGESVNDFTTEEKSAKGVSEVEDAVSDATDVNLVPEEAAEAEHTVSEVTDENFTMETPNVAVSETDEFHPVTEVEDSISEAADETPHVENVEVLVNDFTVEENANIDSQESAKGVSETTLSVVPDVHVDPFPEHVHEADVEEYKTETPEEVSMTDVSLVSAVVSEEIAKTVSGALVSDAEIAADSVDVLNVEVTAEDASSGDEDQMQDVDQVVIALVANNSPFPVPGVSLEAPNNEINQLLDEDAMDEDAIDVSADIQLENEKSVADPMVTEAIAENETEKVIRKVEFDVNVSVVGTPLRSQVLPSPKSSNKKKPATPFPKMDFKVLEEDIDEETSIVDDNKNTNSLLVVAADNKENNQGDDTPQRTLKKASLRQLRKMFKEKLVVSADIKAVLEKRRPALKSLTGNCLVEEDREN